jgi:NAD(P)H-hydrate epimerase
MLEPYLPQIKHSRHKYEAGLVVGLGGSPGYPGAAMLAATAALHGGAGIVRLLHPQGMEAELISSPYELIRIPYDPKNVDEIAENLNKASATFVGPGIGRKPETFELLKELLPKLVKPCVIDADALTLLSGTDIPFPEHTILTPHRGEMNRLLQRTDHPPLTKEYLQECLTFAENRRVTIVLKGGPSFILHPDEPILVCPKGDPGMATAGSGDVLTGLLAALLAQGLTTHHAAALGVYIHGLAGEHAAAELTSYCLIASDIMFRFPEGFMLMET